MTALLVIVAYLGLLLALGLLAARSFRGTSHDFFLASRSIGPFLLLMSVFGTTMTAFALVGSTGKAYVAGVGVYGLMASYSGLVHSAVFFLVGLPLWALGRRHGYVTQVQLFRDRFESDSLGWVLFPILVGLVIPYLLIGLLGAGATVGAVTRGAFGEGWLDATGRLAGVPPAVTSAVICAVVLAYVFFGGLRAAAWANTFQTLVFMVTGVVAFWMIADALGGPAAATAKARPELLVRGDLIKPLHFLSYGFVPLSVGMFPHLFQHWLTARRARTFRLTVIAHPLCIMIVWVPCVLVGVWASGALSLPPAKANAVLGVLVAKLTSPVMSGLLTAGILAAIMSSLDSQFLCLATMFTHDVAVHRRRTLDDRAKVRLARAFVVAVVALSWGLSLISTRGIFDLGVWCFSGFAGLFPLVVATLYWPRATRAGAFACVAAAAVTWIVLFALDLRHGVPDEEFLVFGMMPVALIVAASSAAMVVVSLLTRPPSEATLRRFFPSRAT